MGLFVMEYTFFECDDCGAELRFSFEIVGATRGQSETGKSVRSRLNEMESNVDWLKIEVQSVLSELDHLAEVWGDEGVFRRCRDRLRAVLDQCK